MTKQWFAGNFCPREATCSLEDGALSPSNGPKIRTMDFNDAPPSQPYTATVQQFKDQRDFFDNGTEPESWAKCEGQLLPIAENVALFSLLGTQYGGDGRTTFGIPDLSNEPTTNGSYYIYTQEDIGHGR